MRRIPVVLALVLTACATSNESRPTPTSVQRVITAEDLAVTVSSLQAELDHELEVRRQVDRELDRRLSTQERASRSRQRNTTRTEGCALGTDILSRIACCEGWPNHINSDHGPTSTASGKYGVLDSTWDGYAGYERAMYAPEDVQDRWAREAYAKAGTTPWNASRSCWS